jgi:hypothetical protein
MELNGRKIMKTSHHETPEVRSLDFLEIASIAFLVFISAMVVCVVLFIYGVVASGRGYC